MVEVEPSQPTTAGHRDRPRSLARSPTQPAGDHQMDDGEDLVLELQHQALADAPHVLDPLAGRGGDRRVDRAQDKGAAEADALKNLSTDEAFERLAVGHDVR